MGKVIYEDLTGNRYGHLVVVGRSKEKKSNRVAWDCVCDCGNTCRRATNVLKHGHSVSCGCDKIRRSVETRRLQSMDLSKASEQSFSICKVCGGLFFTTNSTTLYCSDECKKEQARIRTGQKNIKTKQCKQCGKEFIAGYLGDRYFCSDECRNIYEANMKQIQHRKAKYKRRSILESVPQDNYSYEDVYAKSDGICQLCGHPVTAPKSDMIWGGSIDHIIPLSKGGYDTLDNVQLAHHICNSIKCNDEECRRINWNELADTDKRFEQYAIQINIYPRG